ncbi:MAG: DUF1232 domain-containing protein [Planctomyces sp.]|nr:DUF1232 domain-containing protein [Planctomyces sp.]
MMFAAAPSIVRTLALLGGRRLLSRLGPGAATASRLKNGRLNGLFLGLAILYTLWPIDFIPDAIPLLGWLDDGLVLWLGLRAAWARRSTAFAGRTAN